MPAAAPGSGSHQASRTDANLQVRAGWSRCAAAAQRRSAHMATPHLHSSRRSADAHLVGLEQSHADLHAPPLPIRHLVQAPVQINVQQLDQPALGRAHELRISGTKLRYTMALAVSAAERRQLRHTPSSWISLPSSWIGLRMIKAALADMHALCTLRQQLRLRPYATQPTLHTGCLTAPAAQGPLLPPRKSSCPPQCRPAQRHTSGNGASAGGRAGAPVPGCTRRRRREHAGRGIHTSGTKQHSAATNNLSPSHPPGPAWEHCCLQTQCPAATAAPGSSVRRWTPARDGCARVVSIWGAAEREGGGRDMGTRSTGGVQRTRGTHRHRATAHLHAVHSNAAVHSPGCRGKRADPGRALHPTQQTQHDALKHTKLTRWMSWNAGRPRMRTVSCPTMYLPASTCSSDVLPAGLRRSFRRMTRGRLQRIESRLQAPPHTP